jgi:hypothetical protein
MSCVCCDRLRDIETGLKVQIDGLDARTKAAALALASADVTNGGASNAGKLLALDSQGRAAGRVLEVDGPALDALRGRVAAGGGTLVQSSEGMVYLNFGPSTFTVPTAAPAGSWWMIHVHGVQATIAREGGGAHISWGGVSAASHVLASNLYQVIRVVVVSATLVRVTATLLRSGEVTGPPPTHTTFPFLPFGLINGGNGAGYLTLTGARVGMSVLLASRFNSEGLLQEWAANPIFEGTITQDDSILQVVGTNYSADQFGFLLGN